MVVVVVAAIGKFVALADSQRCSLASEGEHVIEEIDLGVLGARLLDRALRRISREQQGRTERRAPLWLPPTPAEPL